MSKAIKIEEQVYDQLDQLRGKRETFSDVVAKLLVTKEGLDTMIGVWYVQRADPEFTHGPGGSQ